MDEIQNRNTPADKLSYGSLTAKEPKEGGQVECVVSVEWGWYVKVFGSVYEAEKYAEDQKLEWFPPPVEEG